MEVEIVLAPVTCGWVIGIGPTFSFWVIDRLKLPPKAPEGKAWHEPCRSLIRDRILGTTTFFSRMPSTECISSNSPAFP